MLVASNVGFRWSSSPRAQRVLDEVDCSIAPGTVTAIVGPNGSGKSTLLSLLAGEFAPGEGEVLLDGAPIAGYSPRALAQRRAVVSQRSLMTAPMRVREVVAMGRTVWATSGRPLLDMQIIDEAMLAVGIADLGPRLYPTLSGGERQRVHIARALAQIWPVRGSSGAYLLLDEATSALDLAHAHTMFGHTRSLARHGIAVAMVVHDLSAALRYADNVLVLSEGRVAASGSPTQTITPAVVARVFGLESRIVAGSDGSPCLEPGRPLTALPPIRSL